MLADLPLFADFCSPYGNQPETCSLIRENTNNPGPSPDLLVHPFQAVSGPDRFSMFERKIKNQTLLKGFPPTRLTMRVPRPYISGLPSARTLLQSFDLEH
jgi:hypothetical protein